MRLHQEIRESRQTGKSLQHGRSLTKLQKELCVVYSVLPLIVFRSANYDGRVVQTGRQIFNSGR